MILLVFYIFKVSLDSKLHSHITPKKGEILALKEYNLKCEFILFE